MDWPLFFQLIASASLAFCGAWLAHSFSAARDRNNKRREQRVTFLIAAYRGIESAANRDQSFSATAIESAVADIQLFGTPSQVELVQWFATEFAEHNGASADALLVELRRDLRRELGFEPVPDHLKFLRLTSNDSPPAA